MLALVPISESEFPGFFDTVVESHAHDNVIAGRCSASDALSLAQGEMKRLLPGIERTPENYLFVLNGSNDDCQIGYLWFGITDYAGKKVASLSQLYIHYRRRGYCRQALQVFEKEALTRGCNELALHVFAANSGALRLYEALGYCASSITMHKELQPHDSGVLRTGAA